MIELYQRLIHTDTASTQYKDNPTIYPLHFEWARTDQDYYQIVGHPFPPVGVVRGSQKCAPLAQANPYGPHPTTHIGRPIN